MSDPIYVNEYFFADQELKFHGFENITFVVTSSNGSFVNLKAIKNTEVKKDAEQELQPAANRKPGRPKGSKPKGGVVKKTKPKVSKASKRSH